jgi:hypothetical protein
MKKISLIFVLSVLVNSSILSQEDNRNFTIQTSPLLFGYDLIYDLLFLGLDEDGFLYIMDMEGQYKINNMFNISLTVSFLVNNVIDGTSTYPTYYGETFFHDVKVFQMNFKPMFIYRPFKTGLEGFYVGVYPSIGWQSYERRYKGRYEGIVDNYLWTEIGLGINLGYKWVFRKGFTLQLGTGIGKTWSIPQKPEFYSFTNPEGIYSMINSDGRMTLKNFDFHIYDIKLGYSF